MPDTVFIPCPVGMWVDVTDGAIKGFITNFSQHQIRYRMSDAAPLESDSFGHTINPQEKRYFNLEGTNGVKVWARGFYDDAAIGLTKDYKASILTSPIGTDFFSEVRKGNIPGHEMVIKRGRNPDVDATVFEEIRWLGGVRTPLLTASTMYANSTSPNDDDLTGTNTWKVEIAGVDISFNRLSEIVSMNGLTNTVNTTAAFLRIDSVTTVENGSFNVRNAGVITVYDSTTNTPQIVVPSGAGISKDSLHTIPAGKTGYLINVVLNPSINPNGLTTFRVMSRLNVLTPGPPWPPVMEVDVFNGVTDISQIDINAGLIFEEFSDLWFEGITDSNNTDMGVTYELLLVDNEP